MPDFAKPEVLAKPGVSKRTLLPAKMSKVRLVFPQRYKEFVVEKLYEFGAIQVEPSGVAKLDKPLPSFEQISERLVRLRALEKSLELDSEIALEDPALFLEDVLEKASSEKLEKAFKKAVEFSTVRGDLERALSRKEELEPFKNISFSPSSFLKRGRVGFSFFVPKMKAVDAVSKIGFSLKGVSHQAGVYSSNGKDYVLVVYDKHGEEKVSKVAFEVAREFVALPQVDEQTFSQAYAKAQGDCIEFSKRKAVLEAEVLKLKSELGIEIVSLRKALEREAVKATLPLKFGKTRNIDVLEGWVQQSKAQRLERELAKVSNNAVVLEDISTSDEPPVIQRNSKEFRPFEVMVKFFSTPRFNEIDPTIFIAIAFPLFFGMIMGDAAYGLVLLGLSFVIKEKAKKSKSKVLEAVSKIALISSLSAVFFGVLYGEFLGFEIETKEVVANAVLALGAGEGLAHAAESAWPHITRLDEDGARLMLLTSVVIGIVHVFLGFVLGAINNFAQGHAKHGYAKVAWAFLEVALVLLGMAALAPQVLDGVGGSLAVSSAAQAVALIAIGAILFIEGGAAAFEVMTLVSNIFSYLRLMAFGISAAVIASLVSGLLGIADFEKIGAILGGTAAFDLMPFVMLIVAFAAFLGGHVFALVLGTFEAGIQSVRLNYVEFFTKFYSGGGRDFVPLREEK